MKKLIKILFGIYIVFLVYVLFLKDLSMIDIRASHMRMYNIIPLKTIMEYFVRLRENSINVDIVVKNLIGNLVLFIPMSFFVCILFNEKTIRYSIKMLIIILLIEVVQYITYLGSFDIDDIILNMAGAVLSYIVLRRLTSRHSKK